MNGLAIVKQEAHVAGMMLVWNASLFALTSYANFVIDKESEVVQSITRLAHEKSCSTMHSLGMQKAAGLNQPDSREAAKAEAIDCWDEAEGNNYKIFERKNLGIQQIAQQKTPIPFAKKANEAEVRQVVCPLVQCIISPCPQPSCQDKEADNREPGAEDQKN